MSWFWKKKESPVPVKPDIKLHFVSGFGCKNKHGALAESEGRLSVGHRICWVCGEISYPAVLGLVFTPRFNQVIWAWEWDKTEEFVRFLDKESAVKIPDETVALLQQQAKKQPTKHVTTEGQPFYTEGLKDGAAELARVILEQLKESE